MNAEGGCAALSPQGCISGWRAMFPRLHPRPPLTSDQTPDCYRGIVSSLTTITPLTAPFTIRAAVCSDEVWKHDSRVSVINPVTFRTVHLTVARNRAVVLWCGYGWSRRIVNLWTHTYNFWYKMWGKICAWRSYDPCSYWACSVYWPGLVGE